MEGMISTFIEGVIGKMSPELRTGIIEFVGKLETTAKATKNPWDDIIVLYIKVALKID